VIIKTVFQFLSDDGLVPELLIVNVCSALIKHLTPFSHICLIHLQLPHSVKEVGSKFQLDRHFFHPKTELQLTLHNWQDYQFSYSLLSKKSK
jgi:hypothetical protein